MSHHGYEPFGQDDPEGEKKAETLKSLVNGLNGADKQFRRRDLTRELLNTTNFIGATGLHPKGQIDTTDEGSIRFALGERNGSVILDFGTPVHWMGMTPQEAADFASALLKKAREVGRKSGQTVAMTIG